MITEIAYAINGSPSSDIPFPSTKETLNYIAFIRFLRTEIEKNPQIKNHPYIAPALNIGTVYTSQLGTTKLTEFTTNYRYPKMLDVDNYMKLVAKTDANGKVVGISDKIKNGLYDSKTSENVYDAFLELFNKINCITASKSK